MNKSRTNKDYVRDEPQSYPVVSKILKVIINKRIGKFKTFYKQLPEYGNGFANLNFYQKLRF